MNYEILNLFDRMYDTMPIAIAYSDIITGKFIEVNRQFCNMTGYSKKEIIGKTSFEFNMWKNPEERILVGKELQEKKRINGKQFELIHKSGEVRYGLFSAECFDDNTFLSFAVDITDSVINFQKKHMMESAIEMSLQLNNMLTAKTKEEIIQYGIDEAAKITNSQIGYFHFIDVKTGTITLTAWSEGTIPHCPLVGNGHSNHYPIEKAGIWVDCVYKKKPVIHNDYPNEKNKKGLPNGHVPVTRDVGVPVMSDGEVVAVLGVGNKESEYVELDVEILSLVAENIWRTVALKESQEKLKKEVQISQNYFELSPIMKVILDSTGNVYEINAAGCVVLEGERKDIVGKNWFDTFIPEDIREELRNGFNKVMSGELININRFPDGFLNGVLTLNDNQKTIEWYNSTLIDNNNKKFQYSTGLDVTIKISLEEQLRQSTKLEAVGLLAGGVAHDFNNILTIIGGHAELLKKKIVKSEHEIISPAIKELCDYAKTKLEKINNAADRAGKLTNQLLAFSRKQIMSPETINVNEFVVKERDLLRKLIREDIEIVLFLEPGIGNVFIDETQLALVFMNLMINAKDAIEEKGKITIETRNVSFDKISNSKKQMVEALGDYVMIVIEDNGAGMTKEIQKRIFEPFFTTKELGKGVGLGLSTVYGIVKQSGGFVWVYSELGEGTTFKVYLPRVENQVNNNVHKQIEPTDYSGTETILVVEDEKDVRDLVVESLRDLGYKVISASNGIEAIEMAKSYNKNIDLLFTDVVMPKMDGRELAVQLSNFLPELKVLYMSGYTDNTIVHRGILDPGTNFIQKPISPNSLAERVREVLDNGT